MKSIETGYNVPFEEDCHPIYIVAQNYIHHIDGHKG
jgi:hypothetical protein